MNHENLLFLGISEDKEYVPRLKTMVGTKNTFVLTEKITTLTEVEMYCKNPKRNITGVFSTSIPLLQKLTGEEKVTLDKYAGSMIVRNGIEYLFINPLEHLNTVNYGYFLAKHYISKLVSPEKWLEATAFNWKLLDATNIEEAFLDLFTSDFVSIDIETRKVPLCITSIAWTGFKISNGSWISTSYCMEIDSDWAVAWMRKLNWEVKAPKVFQNGKYDNAYFFLYSAPVYNWVWDTATAMHSYYSELPKDLGSLNVFFLRNVLYWKDLAASPDKMERLKYNALDTWATGNVIISWISQAPDWAIENYKTEFPLNFPSHMCEMRGIKRNIPIMIEQSKKINSDIESLNKELAIITRSPSFNSNSHVQVKKLMSILGCSDLAVKSSNEITLKKAMYRHPLNARILNLILEVRGFRKLDSTYLPYGIDPKTGEDYAKEYKGRILFALNPHGTDSGRLASREHHFWCGLQIQNIPRGKEVKCTLEADDGFMVAECDLKQAESRDTGYISGDEKVIAAVTGEKDFHAINASAFFGIPYELIYDDSRNKTLDKVTRDLSKRVNHGANYLMGPDVLVDTMGLEAINKAARIMKLSTLLSPRQIAEKLLEAFHRTYPDLSRIFYPAVVKDVTLTNKLVGATGWTRWCFGDPTKNKRTLNSYVAHVPQSLNAMVLNKGFMRVFYEIAMNPAHEDNFKLLAQIHDSVLFQFRIGHEYLADMVRECIEVPVHIKSYSGKEYDFTVPADIKAGKDGKGAKFWSDTE